MKQVYIEVLIDYATNIQTGSGTRPPLNRKYTLHIVSRVFQCGYDQSCGKTHVVLLMHDTNTCLLSHLNRVHIGTCLLQFYIMLTLYYHTGFSLLNKAVHQFSFKTT